MSEQPGPNILDDTRWTPPLFDAAIHLLDRAAMQVWKDIRWSVQVRYTSWKLLENLSIRLRQDKKVVDISFEPMIR